jgi:hypothetical protein
MIEDNRGGMMDWLAPAFLLVLVAAFLVAPWTLQSKLDAVCFGI